MRSFTARHLALASAFPVLLMFSVIPGCSRQSEGERCGPGTDAISVSVDDNADCADGLICTSHSELQNGTNDKANRCCYPATRLPSDARCERSSSAVMSGASGASSLGGGPSDMLDAAGAGGQ